MNDDPPPEQPPETRKLAAIVFTDIVSFSRQVGQNEPRTLRLLARHNQLIEQAVAAHHGHIIKTTGDVQQAGACSALGRAT
jgi:class 3 adenylate cyclase